MGNCCKKRQKRKIVLLLVGLDNAGKTVAVKGLAGENLDNSVPTVGFSSINLKYLDVNVTIYDLGGGPDIRGIWHRYFVDAHGIIFVIDSSDYARINEAKYVLQELLSHRKISGKPVLLLANKQDHRNALDEIDIAEKLELESLVNEQKCPTLIESCSANHTGKNSKIDPGIKKGYQWLLNCILRDYKFLNERVTKDIEEQKFIEKQNRQKQIVKLSTRDLLPENDTNINTCSNPFRPINELISDNGNLVNGVSKNGKNSKIKIKSRSALPKQTNSILKQVNTNLNIRPKSAMDVVKKQLEKTGRRNSFFSTPSNKTAPVTLFTPKYSSPVHIISHSVPQENINSDIKTLTVTDLPNTLEDISVDNDVDDLFILRKFKQNINPQNITSPIHKESDDVTWINKTLKRTNAVQNDYDCIFKDIS